MKRNYLVLLLAAAFLLLSGCGRDRTPRGDAGGVVDASIPADAGSADAAVGDDAATECLSRGASCESSSDCCGDLACFSAGTGTIGEDAGTMITPPTCR